MKKTKKNYVVIQDGIKECGSACLLSLIRYYGGNISINSLLEMTKTDKNGTNFYDLSAAAYQIGMSHKAYKIDDFNMLYNVEKPFISQVILNNYNHFVVVYKMTNKEITIMDPAKGIVKYSEDKFKKIFTGYILILEPYKKIPIIKENNDIKEVIKKVILNNKKLILNIMLFTMIVTIFTCLYSYHFKIIIDYVINSNSLNLLIVSIIFLIIMIIKILTEYLRNNLLLYLNQKIDLSIITTAIYQIISLPYSYYKNRTTGETISRINDLFYVKNAISKIIVAIFLDMILAIAIIIILININMKMSVVLIIMFLLYLLIFLIYKKSIKDMTDTIQEDSSKVNSLLVETVSSYETIKGLSLEKSFVKKINKKYLGLTNNNMYLTKLLYMNELLNDIVTTIGIIIIIYLGGISVMHSEISLGTLITYNTLIYYFLNPIKNLFDFYQEFYYVKNSITRINNLMNVKYDKLDKKTELSLDGDITLKHLSFCYNPKNIILKDLNLIIPKHNKVLVLGSSGSGKSTLLKLIYRYYEVERDKLFINNYDINDFSIPDIRENIAYISQNEFLYTDTIRNNIILDRHISDEKFVNICRLTHIDEIIKDKIISYDFPLEENGVNISGGQRQRIILARALLKESNIILIDEGLNELDINLERKILKGIFEYFKDKTFIIVSHRLDNMDLYDKVITLSNGEVKEVMARE